MLQLTGIIKKFALEDAGFDMAGISRASLPEAHTEAFKAWIEKGYAGSMEYMVRDTDRRANPQAALPSAVSVISLAVNYFHPEDPRPAGKRVGKVARYAYGRDYHKIIEKKLKRLAEFIRQIAGKEIQLKAYVDTGPILEKAFAQKSGLGFFGKHTNIITRPFGSWVFLASLITDLELVQDEPHTGSCGSCRICIDACPTGALLGNYEMDATRCISYLTIENKAEPGDDLGKKMGEWLFGCDICQEVCPHNRRAQLTRHDELYPNSIAGTWVDIDLIEAMKSDEEFAAKFQGSPVKRAKRQGLLRNAKIVSKNFPMV